MSTSMQSTIPPDTPGPIPGEGLKMGEKAMQMGTGMMQSFKPISKICEHVCGIHLYCHDNTRQVRQSLQAGVSYSGQ